MLTRSDYSKPEFLQNWLAFKNNSQVTGLDMGPTDGAVLVGGRFGIGVLHEGILREQRRLVWVSLENRHGSLVWS